VLNPVAPLADTTNFTRFGLPDCIVIVSWADDGMGDLMQDRVLNFPARRRQAVAHR